MLSFHHHPPTCEIATVTEDKMGRLHMVTTEGIIMRLILLTVSILCICCIVAALPETPTMPRPDFTGQPTYQVTRVIDGDTVELMIDGKATTVRLIGVATPETIHPGKALEHYGTEGSIFLTNLLKGEEVYIEWEAKDAIGRYARPLVYLYRSPDGLFANLEIIRQGYGRVYDEAPCQYLELFTHYGPGLR